jgi:mRNA interferase MazF
MNYYQYQIVIVNLDPTMGSEVKKTRPCLIVSPDEMNRHLLTITICPITSQSRQYPTRIEFDLEGEINWIMIDQIRTIDKSRVIKIIDSLDDETILKVKDVIQETFVD